MKTKNVTFIVFLISLVFLSAWSVQAAETVSSGSDLPIICAACGDGSQIKYGDTNPAWQGHLITVPVQIKNPGDSLNFIELYGALTSTNLKFQGIDTSGSPWPNALYNVTILGDSQHFEIYVNSNGANLPIWPSLRRVFDLKIYVMANTPYNVSYYLKYGQRVDIHRYNSGPVCQPDTTWGSIVIPDDTTRISLDWKTAFSYQASAADDDSCKDDFPLTIPVNFYSNYPCSSYCFPFVIPVGTTFLGYDALVDGDSAVNQVYWGSRTVTVYGNFTSEPPNYSDFHLGNIKIKIPDYRSNYQDTAFTDTLYTNLWSGAMPKIFKCHPWLNANNIAFADVVKDTAGIVLPKYKSSFDILDATVDGSGNVAVPMTINPSFYSADYDLFIQYSTSKLTYSSLLGGGLPLPTPGATNPTSGVLEIGTLADTFQICRYARPDTLDTLFTVNFAKTAGFVSGESTEVKFYKGQSYRSWIWDWFSLNHDDGAHKIDRGIEDSTNCFFMSSGWVRYPRKYTLDASVLYQGNNKFDASINISQINFTGDTKAYAYINLPPGVDSAKVGDFPLDSIRVSLGGSSNDYNVKVYPTSTISATGTLCHVWFHNTKDGNLYISGPNSYMYYNSGSQHVADSKSDTAIYQHKFPKLEGDTPLPYANSLSQNYPNPFNGATNVSFTLSQPGLVTLDIFDVLGRKVKAMTNQQYSAGAHSIIWNGTNDHGEDVAGGVYFYTIKTDDFQDSKRMLYLK